MKVEIILISLIIVTYNYFISSEYFDEDTIKIKLIPLALFGLFAFLVFILTIMSIFYYRTTYYINYLKDIDIQNNSFGYIKKIKLNIPDEYTEPLLKISKVEGVRIEIPSKKQKCISLKRLQKSFPQIVEWYKSLPSIMSKIIGTKLKITPLTQSNSLCLVVYEKEGDFIDWHFDTNHYNGRFFTLLIPISYVPTCGNFQYKNSNQITQTVELSKGEALLFEGEKVYHKAKKLCGNQRRVILSCTFTTSQEIPTIEIIFQQIKNLGIFGEL